MGTEVLEQNQENETFVLHANQQVALEGAISRALDDAAVKVSADIPRKSAVESIVNELKQTPGVSIRFTDSGRPVIEMNGQRVPTLRIIEDLLVLDRERVTDRSSL